MTLFSGEELWEWEDFPMDVLYFDRSQDRLKRVTVTREARDEVEEKLRGEDNFTIMKTLELHESTESNEA